jgi:protein gp37
MPPPQERQQNDQIVQSTVQVGGLTPKAGGRELDGRTWDEFPSPAPVAVGAGRVEAL